MAGKRRNFSGQLRALIVARGESLAHIGKAAGVSHAALSRFLRRERGLSTKSLDRLCGYLGLELRRARRKRGG